MTDKDAVKLLAALAQESRLAIFRLLIRHGAQGLPAGGIGEALGVAPNTLSFHLKELSHAGLLTARHQGRYVYYAADYGAMNGLLSFMTENCCDGAPCPADCAGPAPEATA